ncbi:hypothetical protein JB92DRAFT_3149680 [Gautieria morchelliformis]|nr:hypothetical protein JB92DRAFT_3149680 [Gautieria morchelliformis]
MDDATTQATQSQPTILRIKRKRTDEPLDALVVESKSRRKKSRGVTGFFQFAETVEARAFWQDPSLTKDLRTRISTLASGEVRPDMPQRDTNSPQATPGRRYTIVKNIPENRPLASPVTSAASHPKSLDDADFTMYDAIPESNSSVNKTTEAFDPEMAKFLPMLQEYLRMNNELSNIAPPSAKVDEAEEYVWDVFYHRPATTKLVAVANIATVTGLPSVGQYDSDSGSDSAGDEDDEDSNTEDFYRNDYPDEDPDQESDGSLELSASDDEDIPENEDERDLHAFLAWRGRR